MLLGYTETGLPSDMRITHDHGGASFISGYDPQVADSRTLQFGEAPRLLVPRYGRPITLTLNGLEAKLHKGAVAVAAVAAEIRAPTGGIALPMPHSRMPTSAYDTNLTGLLTGDATHSRRCVFDVPGDYRLDVVTLRNNRPFLASLPDRVVQYVMLSGNALAYAMTANEADLFAELVDTLIDMEITPKTLSEVEGVDNLQSALSAILSTQVPEFEDTYDIGDDRSSIAFAHTLVPHTVITVYPGELVNFAQVPTWGEPIMLALTARQ